MSGRDFFYCTNPGPKSISGSECRRFGVYVNSSERQSSVARSGEKTADITPNSQTPLNRRDYGLKSTNLRAVRNLLIVKQRLINIVAQF